MRPFIHRVVRLLASVLICGITLAVAARAANAQQEAITATVVGENIQKVGFRAIIQKQAIMYNLAGYARNNPDGTVGVGLQGDGSRIAKALEVISAGNKKSSKANIIGEAPAPVDPNLRTFTVFSRTSKSRNISNGVVTGTIFGRARIVSRTSGSGRRSSSPRPEGFLSQDAERAAGCEMALDIESVLEGGMNRQESLADPDDLKRCILRSRRRVG
jgi:acylphosphatase